MARHFELGDRRILRYQDPELGDHLRRRYRFRELDAVGFSHGHPSAVFEFKLSGLGSASAVNRAARQLRSAAEMIRQGYGHQPKVAVVLIHAGEGHPDLGKPGGRYGVRHHPVHRLHLSQWPETPIPCLIFSMREAVEEARRIGHEVDHALEKRAAREGKHGIQQGRRILPRLPLGEVLSAVSWMAKELVQAVGQVARRLTPRRKPAHHPHRRRRRRRHRGRGPGGPSGPARPPSGY